MSAFQAGFVSFLFTDIEGSTRLWESDQEAMSAALRRHDAILHAAITDAGGRIFKTAGDAFCAAFPNPSMAVAAAVAAQRTLVAEPWPPATHLRVRMAIHTGPAESRGGDYFGQPLNRVARLLAAAHGEQIVVSHAASESSRGQLPAGVTLRDLGAYALKDLPEPERIAQITGPGLRHDFPPLRTPDRLLRNLPLPSTALIGRDDAIAAARAAFGLVPSPGQGDAAVPGRIPAGQSTRLLTLTGPGGTGKSRLSLHLAREIGLELADGAVFVPLATITDPALVPVAISNALDLAEGPSDAPRQQVLDQLQDRHLLLVLDNFEQVMGAAPFVADILAHCPRVIVVATSRERLHVRGEQELPLPPLALPVPRLSEAAHDINLPLTIEEIRCSPAVQLFVARAQAGKPDFELTDENASTIAELCRRLDGLPLAIELAAARVRLLTPQALLERFERRLDVLSRGARDLPERQRTMRDTIAWSYDLLDPDEQRLFADLSVFVGGATLSAVCAVLSDVAESGADQIDLLELLADKSLLRIIAGDDDPRVFMFETIRDYACERLNERGAQDIVARCHADHYLAFAEQAEPLLAGREQALWLSRLDQDQANLRAAITWLRAHGHPEKALRLGAALWRFWWLRGDIAAARALLEELLQEGAASDQSLRAKALNGAGVLAESQGDQDTAFRFHQESLAIYRRVNDPLGVAWSLNNLGVVELNRGNLDSANELLHENLVVAEDLGDVQAIATALIDLGQAAWYRDDHHAAVDFMTGSLELFRKVGAESHVARALNNLGNLALEGGELDRAHGLLSESLALHRAVGDRQGIAGTLNNLAEVESGRGDTATAMSLYRESYALSREGGNHLYAAIAVENLGALAASLGDPRAAEAHFQEALVLYQKAGDEQGILTSLAGLASSVMAHGAPELATALFATAATLHAANASLDFPDLASSLQSLRDLLGNESFDAIWSVASATPREAIIAQVGRNVNAFRLP